MFKKLRQNMFGQKPVYRKLELPITLRVPLPNEVPMDTTILANIKKSQIAKIVEGYTIKNKDNNSEHSNLEFEFYSEINIDNSKLWSFFIELTNFLPSEISLISGHIDDEEINYGQSANKHEIINFISKYEKELTADTFMKFGLISHSDKKLIEVFIDETKYIKFWGSNKTEFKNVLQNYGLINIEDLEFIDEYPKVRHSLISLDETVSDTEELLEILKNKYK